MKTRCFMWLLCSWAIVQNGLAQERPSQCVAAFVGKQMVVDAYTTTGKCRLPDTATGELAVYTVDLSPTENKAVDKVDFQIAIRDGATKTLTMFSGRTYRQVPVQSVLAKCQKGDHIVLLTVDSRYALPHHEILVQ